MTKEQIAGLVERIEGLPSEAQEEIVRSIEEIEARFSRPYPLTSDDRAALARSDADVRNGRFATEEQVSEVFSRYRT